MNSILEGWIRSIINLIYVYLGYTIFDSPKMEIVLSNVPEL